VIHGWGAWRPRIEQFPEVFEAALGQRLFPGTLNVQLDTPLPIQPDFKILGEKIGEPDQDMLFEHCRVNGIEALRLRPFQPATGAGGHGDDVLEIVCSQQLRPLLPQFSCVVVEFPRLRPPNVAIPER
jgi:CTP-dependent riboflavin kinase